MNKIDLESLFFNISVPENFNLLESQIKIDSRQVVTGDCFFAIQGSSYDSHKDIESIIESCSYVFSERSADELGLNSTEKVIYVDSSRLALDRVVAWFHRASLNKISCIGITGTNGKTSTAYYIERLLEKSSHPAAVIGTIDHHYKEKVWPTKLTSPGSKDLYPRVSEMQVAGAKVLVMEVSSHALDQHRCSSVPFELVSFLNLSQDHLDYHESMEEYYLAKRKLFFLNGYSTALVNIDDSYGARLSKDLEGNNKKQVTFGKSDKADFQFYNIKKSWEKTSFEIDFNGQIKSYETKLLGDFNLYNLSVAILTYHYLLGQLPSTESLKAIENVPGRMQKIDTPSGPVFVDYSHTPDALENALDFLQSMKKEISPKSRVICVFGAGGDRDKAKRSKMAEIAEKYSELVIITSDNPRTENPETILDDIDLGFSNIAVRKRIENRASAIQFALQSMGSGDIVLIAGKGHETYQEINGRRSFFSDTEEVEKFLQEN
ncbi:MAG: UDP-N-acetylmuramoyl-L-alanyl-D-glutamate--2,6-diaminopimelate ligase [Bdellovibrionales bacterium]